MSIKWGPSTWLLLHSLSFKVKEEEFDSVKLELIDIFKQMCFVLPCPYCQKHAKEYITSKDFNKIKSKQDFIDMLWVFHNIVNVKTGKKVYKREDLKVYENAVLKNVVINFQRTFMKPINNQRLLMDTLGRERVIQRLNVFLKNNYSKFAF